MNEVMTPFQQWFGKPSPHRATEPYWSIPMPVDRSWFCNTPFTNIMASMQSHVCIRFCCKRGKIAAMVFHIQKQHEKMLSVRDVHQWARQLKIGPSEGTCPKKQNNHYLWTCRHFGNSRESESALDCHKIHALHVVWGAEGDCIGPRHSGLL